MAHPPLDTQRWRETLQNGRNELRQAYLAKANAAALLRGHSRLVDKLLQTIWRQLSLPPSSTLVAVGGYGRKQLFPGSDIDLLILLPADPDETLQQKLEQP